MVQEWFLVKAFYGDRSFLSYFYDMVRSRSLLSTSDPQRNRTHYIHRMQWTYHSFSARSVCERGTHKDREMRGERLRSHVVEKEKCMEEIFA